MSIGKSRFFVNFSIFFEIQGQTAEPERVGGVSERVPTPQRSEGVERISPGFPAVVLIPKPH